MSGRVQKEAVSTHSVLPLFFKSVFKLPDLLLKALNPSSELGRCQVLLLIFVGAQRGAAAPVRGTGRVSFPGVVTACCEGRGGRGVWYGEGGVLILSNKRKPTAITFCDPQLYISCLLNTSNLLQLAFTPGKARTEMCTVDFTAKFERALGRRH